MFEKHLWKSDILSKDADHRPASLLKNVTLPQVFFKHFASKSQLLGFYISGTLVENGLIQLHVYIIYRQASLEQLWSIRQRLIIVWLNCSLAIRKVSTKMAYFMFLFFITKIKLYCFCFHASNSSSNANL